MGSSSSSSIILLLFLAIFLAIHVSVLSARGLGGWTPIGDVNDAHVKELGAYAVSEHNKENKTALVFEKVLSGETQVVSGIDYRLAIEAKSGDTPGHYEAVVWEKPWLKFKQLTSFEAIKA